MTVAALYVDPKGAYADLPGVELQSRRERNATPEAFRDVLLDIARSR